MMAASRNRLARVMEDYHVTEAALVRACGLRQPHVNRIRHGGVTPDLETAWTLVAGLRVAAQCESISFEECFPGPQFSDSQGAAFQ